MSLRAFSVLVLAMVLGSACGATTSDVTDDVRRLDASAEQNSDAALPVDVRGTPVPLVEGVALATDFDRRWVITLHSRTGSCAAFRAAQQLPSQDVLALDLRNLGPGTYDVTSGGGAPDDARRGVLVRLVRSGAACEAAEVLRATSGTLVVERVSPEGIAGTLQFAMNSLNGGPATAFSGRFFAALCEADVVDPPNVRACAAEK